MEMVAYTFPLSLVTAQEIGARRKPERHWESIEELVSSKQATRDCRLLG
jgi:hypothetical protein